MMRIFKNHRHSIDGEKKTITIPPFWKIDHRSGLVRTLWSGLEKSDWLFRTDKQRDFCDRKTLAAQFGQISTFLNFRESWHNFSCLIVAEKPKKMWIASLEENLMKCDPGATPPWQARRRKRRGEGRAREEVQRHRWGVLCSQRHKTQVASYHDKVGKFPGNVRRNQ